MFSLDRGQADACQFCGLEHWMISYLMLFYSEWSSLENEMGDGLQKSGHYMDRWAGSAGADLVGFGGSIEPLN